MSLCEGLGLQKMAKDPRFITNEKRVENRSILIPIIEERFKTRTRDEWLNIMEKLGLPVAPVYTIDEIFNDPQVKHRGLVIEMDHKEAGKIKQIAPTIKFSETPCITNLQPPILGEHTEEVLTTLANFTPQEIAVLREKRVI